LVRTSNPRIDGARQVAELLDRAVVRDDHEEVLRLERGQPVDAIRLCRLIVRAVDRGEIELLVRIEQRTRVAGRGRRHQLQLVAGLAEEIAIQDRGDPVARACLRTERDADLPPAIAGEHFGAAIFQVVRELGCKELQQPRHDDHARDRDSYGNPDGPPPAHERR
jgi:hypothetical protein